MEPRHRQARAAVQSVRLRRPAREHVRVGVVVRGRRLLVLGQRHALVRDRLPLSLVGRGRLAVQLPRGLARARHGVVVRARRLGAAVDAVVVARQRLHLPEGRRQILLARRRHAAPQRQRAHDRQRREPPRLRRRTDRRVLLARPHVQARRRGRGDADARDRRAHLAVRIPSARQDDRPADDPLNGSSVWHHAMQSDAFNLEGGSIRRLENGNYLFAFTSLDSGRLWNPRRRRTSSRSTWIRPRSSSPS